MTYQNNCTLPKEMLEQIAEQGLDVIPEMMRTLINAAMQMERQAYLGAALSALQRRDVLLLDVFHFRA
jgi:hypothetical protein